MEVYEKFNLSEELKELFKLSFLIAKTYNWYEISVDSVVASILERYLGNHPGDRKKDDMMIKFADTFNEEDRNKVLDMINDEMIKESSMLTINPSFSKLFSSSSMDKSSIVLSDSLDYMLRRLDTRYEHREISVFDFIHSVTLDNNSRIMEKLKAEFGITYDKLSNFKMAHLVTEEFAKILGDGVLKEKNISYNNDQQPGGDDNRKKEDIENEDKEFEMAGSSGPEIDPSKNDPNSDTPWIDMFSTDLNKQCRLGKFDPVVGRDNEISQVIEILSCRKKSNCVLTGDPGVGKTSVVIGLVQAIESGNVPRDLKGKVIKSVDINAMVSGSTYRGDFEKKLLGVLNELSSHPEIIAFIDEIHNIVGAGSNTDGKGDAGALMKPYLSGTAGNITIIGATTDEEYRKFIEKDGALKRRFQEVSISEPSVEETIDILTKVAPKYEEFHRVKYTPEVIQACVEWSNVYINDRQFPDKAIDCLDISGSLTKLGRVVDVHAIENLEAAIKSIIEEKISLVDNCEFEEAQKRRDTEVMLKKQLEEEKKKVDESLSNQDTWPEVTIDNIASVISKVSRIPVDKIRQTSFGKLKAMKESMEKTVIGQGDAIKEVSMSLNRQFMGLKDKNRPASFLFAGSTGTGKTYLAKIIAKELFGTEKALIKVDCSLFTSSTSVNRLLGSDPGYVGYDSKTIFHEIKKRPFSVVLFDEIEKMNEEVINTVFLPLLDEGKVNLSDGEEINFRNCIIIMTSNLGTRELENKTNLGFSGKLSSDLKRKDDEDTVMKAIRKKMRPELIGRIGSIVFFNSLGEEELKSIFDLELNKLKERIGENGFTLEVTDKVRDFVVSKCDLKYGARELNKQMITYIENEISNSLISQENPDSIGKNIWIDIVDSKPFVKFGYTTTILIESEKKEKDKVNS